MSAVTVQWVFLTTRTLTFRTIAKMLKNRLSVLISLSFTTMACTETKTSKPTPRVTMDAGANLADSGSSMTDSGVAGNLDSGMAMSGLLTIIAEADG